MTCSVYVFGNLTDGYTQYPDDYAIAILQQFHSLSSSPSQVIIHRENSLMYYGYIRGLDNSMGYIGFCVLINGMMLTHISQLFNIYEDVVAEMAAKGEIITLNNQGNVIPVVSSLSDKEQEIALIASNIQNRVSRMMEDAVKLPPVGYDVSTSEKKYFTILDDDNEIVEATGRYSYTYISKQESPDSPQLSGYKGVIRQMREEQVQLTDEYNRLKVKYDQLERQKSANVGQKQLESNISSVQVQKEAESSSVITTPSIIGKWNWGAFWFGGLWGLFNGVYWPLILIPLNFIFPAFGWIPSIIVGIYLGVRGNELSWENKNWASIEEFEQSQKGCSIVALVFFIIFIVLLFAVILAI